ncbi:MAG: hypothetical protein AB7R69_05220 [Candidatus Babeliales bacterium]
MNYKALVLVNFFIFNICAMEEEERSSYPTSDPDTVIIRKETKENITFIKKYENEKYPFASASTITFYDKNTKTYSAVLARMRGGFCPLTDEADTFYELQELYEACKKKAETTKN